MANKLFLMYRLSSRGTVMKALINTGIGMVKIFFSENENIIYLFNRIPPSGLPT